MSMTKSNMTNPTFYKLSPAYQSYLWGGKRLSKEYGKSKAFPILAESWECSTHPNGLSYIPEFNQTLAKRIQDYPQGLGSHCSAGLPILVKFIDAYDDLSVQVHPDDNYAHNHENGQNGKTELWYVVDASKNAQLIYGFYEDVTSMQLKESIHEGSIDKYLQKVPVQSDDVFLIKPGLVHAIGKGCLIVEIQQNSDLTYRLYDYNRKDANGNLRQLHIDKAMEVLNFNASDPAKQPLRVLKYYPGYAKELLGITAYFMVQRLLINASGVEFITQSTSFALLVCIAGNATIANNSKQVQINKGDTVLVEANQTAYLSGNARFIEVTC